MPVGKQVFLLGIGAIPTVMLRMTPAVTTVKKAAVGGKKSPAGAGRKTAALGKPLPGPPQGAGAHSCCVLGDWVVLPPFGEGTEKVPFFYDQNGKCLRFVTSLSANRLK